MNYGYVEFEAPCIPEDWGEGYDNVTVGCTIENRDRADHRLFVSSQLPIKHKNIIYQPLIEEIHLVPYLKGIELDVSGGELDYNAIPLHYDWIISLRKQYTENGVHFQFRQCGSHFFKKKSIR